jgi:hypothetical protein
MELSEIQAHVAELEQQIAELPAGSVTKKAINGNVYFYHAGQRTRSAGRSIFLQKRWILSRNRLSDEKHWKKN